MGGFAFGDAKVGNFGGGVGSTDSSYRGTAGRANTGSGGGGSTAESGSNQVGGTGGSGFVCVRYARTFRAAVATTGSPTITSDDSYWYYKYTADGSITF
jgi:hypothetical protein